MTLVGCDLHSLDPDTGVFGEEELAHEADAVKRFYSGLSRPVTVDFETTDDTLWFYALMQKLGHTLLVGGAAKVRTMVVRDPKTDRREARHLLDLLRRVTPCLSSVWQRPQTRPSRGIFAVDSLAATVSTTPPPPTRRLARARSTVRRSGGRPCGQRSGSTDLSGHPPDAQRLQHEEGQ